MNEWKSIERNTIITCFRLYDIRFNRTFDHNPAYIKRCKAAIFQDIFLEWKKMKKKSGKKNSENFLIIHEEFHFDYFMT